MLIFTKNIINKKLHYNPNMSSNTFTISEVFEYYQITIPINAKA